jgi:Zn-dependent protease with chaperone function
MRTLAARCFGPGLPAVGVAVRAIAEARGLYVEAGEMRRELPWAGVTARRGGFNDGEVQLQFEDGGRWVVSFDASVMNQLRTNAPPALAAALEQTTRGAPMAGYRRALGWSALVLFLVLPVALLGLFVWQSARIAEWGAARVSIAAERQLGEHAFAAQRGQLKLLESGPAIDAVQKLGERIAAGSRYKFSWYVAEDPSVNAFAIPGGIVVVHTGLISSASDVEELAGVLAHEIQHVELRHSLRAVVHQLGWRALLAFLLGDLGTVGDVAASLGELGFGRDQESEADRAGFSALGRAGIDPQGMLRFFEKLAKDEVDVPRWLSSHPASADRLSALRELAKSSPAANPTFPIEIDFAAVKASLKR